MVRDFELMKTNAIKFNGQASPITQEAIAIFDYVRDQIEASRDEFASLEVAVQEQMSGKPKKKKKQAGTKKSSAASGNVGMVGGVQVNLGDFKFEGMSMDGIDSDSDDSFTGLLDA
jgi:transcription initiation factor TFIID subunit 1